MHSLPLLGLLCLGLVACAEQMATFGLESEAFEAGKAIPRRFACDGEDLSPPLRWSDPPGGTKSFALVVDDPDAPMGTWDHWLLFDLDPALRSLDEGLGNDAERERAVGTPGRNSWKRRGYGGPCPPGGTHRYFFRLYALDARLGLETGRDKKALLKAMESHILARAELMGTYEIIE